MELRHIRYLVAVAEAGSLSEAARSRLHTAQPSLSRQLHELELELGVQLLERRARGVSLTRAGSIFLEHGRRILHQVDDAIAATRSAPALLRVGSLPGLEPEILPKVRALVSADGRAVDVRVTGASSPRMLEELRAGNLDMAFMRQDEDAPDIHFMIVGEHRIVALLPVDHPLAGSDTLAFSDLVGEAYIAVSRKAAPSIRTAIDAWGQQRGLALEPIHTAANIASALSLMLTTRAFTLMPEYAAKLASSEIVTRSLVDGPYPLPLAIAYRPANGSAVQTLVHTVASSWI